MIWILLGYYGILWSILPQYVIYLSQCPKVTQLSVTNPFSWSILVSWIDQVTHSTSYVRMYYKLKKERVMTKEENIAYLASGGKIIYCPPGNAKNAKGSKTTSTRPTKNQTYNTTFSPGLRSMNWNSILNVPVPYNGHKMMMNHY